MDQGVTDLILTIVHTLAKGTDHGKVTPLEADIFNKNVAALLPHDGDEFIRVFLAAVKEAHSILTPNIALKLANYP